MYYRAIVCLANSRKHRGKCVAGKDISNYVWVRPVADTETGELVLEQIRYGDGSIPKVLDIIRVPLKQRHPKIFQPENVYIRSETWEKVGTFPENKLDSLCDNPPTLWNNNQPSKDRISYEFLKENRVGSSLLLIKPTAMKIKCEDRNDDYGQKKRILRGLFTYNQIHYDLRVTDPYIENKYQKMNSGTFPLTGNKIYLCISLGEPYQGNCYKLIASIITIEEKPSESILLEPEGKQALYENLRKWRTKQAHKENDVPPYVIAHDRSLKEIIDMNVKSKEDLLLVHGFGEKRIEKYGDEIIKVLESYYKGSDSINIQSNKRAKEGDNIDVTIESPIERKKGETIDKNNVLNNIQINALNELKEWRKQLNLTNHYILGNRSLQDIVLSAPTDLIELSKVKGIGKFIVENYGQEIINILNKYQIRK